MTQNQLVADERRNQPLSAPGEAPPTTPSNGGVATDTSTVVSESPTFVTQTRAERVVADVPAGPGQPLGSSVMTTRTTMFSGDPAFRGTQVVWALLGLTELIIGLRVLFRLLAATDTGFVSIMYGLGGALAAPFRGVANYTTGTTVIEVGSLIAMLVYVLAAFLVVKVVRIAVAPKRSSAS
jgi:hypothetical protein